MFKKIKKPFIYKFNVSKDGLYSISMEARCKSGRLLGIFGGEDLRVEIDGLILREIPPKWRAQHFNIPPSWNGTKLNGLSKTVIFVLRLAKGEHELRFIPKKGAVITKEPVISEVKDGKLVLNNKAHDGNRRPWITLALIDLELKILDASVTCEQREKDSDDIKIIIDNKIQKNSQANWWGKNWRWQGRQLQGKTEEARFYPNLFKGLHYIEFWADRMPILNWVKVYTGASTKEAEKSIPKSGVQIYNPGPTGQEYNQYDEDMAHAVEEWNDIFLFQTYPPPEPLDPNLVKAMIYYETGMGQHHGPNDPYPDIMQVGDVENPAIDALLGRTPANEFIAKDEYGYMSYNYPNDKKPNADTPQESIFWGVRWLYHKAQYFNGESGELKPPYVRGWRDWQTAVQLYNSDQDIQPGIGDSDYGKNVFLIYHDGVDPRDGRRVW